MLKSNIIEPLVRNTVFEMVTHDFTNVVEITQKTNQLKENIRNILSDTTQKIKKLESKQKKENLQMEQMLNKEKEELEKNQILLEEKKIELENLKKELENNQSELHNFRIENENLKKQIEEAEEIKRCNLKLYEELTRRSATLNLQLENTKKQSEIQEAEIKKIADNYRRLLGLNVEQITYNQLKITFSNFDEKETTAFFILDFTLSETGNITELYPQICQLDKVNQILAKESDFHIFLKKMRMLFYESIKETV